MNANDTNATTATGRSGALQLAAVLGGLLVSSGAAFAQDPQGKSFVDTFDTLDRSRWLVSDGWDNGKHQNCTWSKDQVKVADGKLTLAFEAKPLKNRDNSCGEIQTKARFSYGTYEARVKSGEGSGLNAAFFSYIGPVHKQPHDEIDFEILTKDTSKVQVNAYVDGKSGNEQLIEVAGGADKDFNDYAFVWEKDRLRWYLNGKLVHELASPARLPSHPQKIFFSLWGSDTLREWMGPFTTPASPVTMEVERVAYTAPGEPCQFEGSVACKTQ
ncbi:family 16 glycosylhydrolase [Aminobacter sp. HY435]|uniref:endo-1,3-1,4-beta-glycanase ExoK n=1 Tax=Aminobacter sp. HY435 TaxID=2970917 RepID=UPI0022B9B07E|nr:family 16 glycosylhydrolase [Aminobacter sp. HY435]